MTLRAAVSSPICPPRPEAVAVAGAEGGEYASECDGCVDLSTVAVLRMQPLWVANLVSITFEFPFLCFARTVLGDWTATSFPRCSEGSWGETIGKRRLGRPRATPTIRFSLTSCHDPAAFRPRETGRGARPGAVAMDRFTIDVNDKDFHVVDDIPAFRGVGHRGSFPTGASSGQPDRCSIRS